MVSAGLTALPCSSYDLRQAASGQNNMKILCIGHGGGSLPLFLASKFRGATVHIVEIDPVVVSASIEAMGFPMSSVIGLSSESMLPADADDLLLGGIHDRIFLHIADAEDFIVNDSNQYDLVFIDAYDGDDIFPRKLWDANGTFMKNLEEKVHPVHGTVVVNLHSDSELSASDQENDAQFQSILPMGKHVSQVCRAYKQHFGLAFTAAVPWLCNITLVACRDKAITSGARLGLGPRDFVLGKLLSKSDMVERALGLPFPCLPYIKNDTRGQRSRGRSHLSGRLLSLSGKARRMLLRSSSTPFLHPSFLSSSSSFPNSPSSLQLRRAFSDSHIPSLHRPSLSSTRNDAGSITNKPTSGGGLRTELSFSIYNTFGEQGGGATLASQEEPRHDDQQHEEPPELQGQQRPTVQPDHPEVPLFLARGLGIDRIASGFFTAGKTKGGAGAKTMEGVEEVQDEKVAALDAQYKRMVDEQPGNALFLRNYAQFLHEVKGDPRRAEEYYSRAMLADPGDGEIMSQYAKLVWEVHRNQERCLGYFQKSVQAAPQNSHVLAAYASFLWEQDDDDLGEGEQGMGGAGAADQRAAHKAGQVRELASAAV
ncbi:hypothetical protein BAE44_0011397 [Dichanthelium oligosanthes]|uniref:TmcB/TmcC TPR repeats domain-containing protein n=1 Tax=Dichanthelium oligosanthes TaxID=888268 RepID=A0A1E5VR53_9POAL|nr:hypothetical protein BAE44_0011397 [Dichanthelium oligosanthes]